MVWHLWFLYLAHQVIFRPWEKHRNSNFQQAPCVHATPLTSLPAVSLSSYHSLSALLVIWGSDRPYIRLWLFIVTFCVCLHCDLTPASQNEKSGCVIMTNIKLKLSSYSIFSHNFLISMRPGRLPGAKGSLLYSPAWSWLQHFSCFFYSGHLSVGSFNNHLYYIQLDLNCAPIP